MRRRSFFRAHRLLDQLRRDPTQIGGLQDLQRHLIQSILRVERRIADARAALRRCIRRLKVGRLPKDAADQVREEIVALKSGISDLERANYLWRCFGDAILFVYLDRFALKQVFYDTRTGAEKQAAGFLSGKAGLEAELILCEAIWAAGFPCVLSDITSTVRFGDVCVLVGPDPILLEAKSGERVNQRGKRQIEALQRLQEFLESDVAQDFRGAREIRRAAVPGGEKVYLDELNSCLGQAKREGFCVVEPEPGLHYIAIYSSDVLFDEILPLLQTKRPIVFYLNALKAQNEWAPYCPFTLSIRSAHHLADFIEGRVAIMVCFDKARLDADLEARGIRALGEEPSIWIYESDGLSVAIGMHLVRRVGLEFCSLRWIFATLEARLAEVVAIARDGQSPA